MNIASSTVPPVVERQGNSFISCWEPNKNAVSARYKRKSLSLHTTNDYRYRMLIGRKAEQQELLRAFGSDYSEFVAVTGRRRVGKTFLVRETFDYTFVFQHSGLANQNTRAQLREFLQSLLRCGLQKCRIPADWSDAFFLLSQLLDQKEAGKKVVLLTNCLGWIPRVPTSFLRWSISGTGMLRAYPSNQAGVGHCGRFNPDLFMAGEGQSGVWGGGASRYGHRLCRPDCESL